MGIKVQGVKESLNQLNSLIGNVQGRKAARAIQSALMIGGERAATYTPIGKTSNLINSQYREIEVNGTCITGRIGYTANYTAYVADPKIKMKFRLETAQKDFLNKGFKDTKGEILEAITRELHS